MVVVDAEDLELAQLVVRLCVEALRAREIVAERLLDHDAAKVVPLVFALPRQAARGREGGDGAREELGLEREVVEAPGVLSARKRVEGLLDALEVGGLTDVARHVVDARRELLEPGA
jgi:hypothetical protein